MEKCKKHPKFKGNKAPKSECLDCLNFYLKLKGKRLPIAKPGFAHKSKKHYKRKEKHKTNEF